MLLSSTTSKSNHTSTSSNSVRLSFYFYRARRVLTVALPAIELFFRCCDMMEKWCIFCGWFLVLMVLVGGLSVKEKIRDDPDLSEFYATLESTSLPNITLQHMKTTVFAPTNEAFQKLGRIDFDREALVMYHMTNLPKTIDQLGSSHTPLYSEAEGNPPLWVTHAKGQFTNEVYINNAKILVEQSNFKSKNPKGQEQVLHKIDEVLLHVRPTQPNPSFYNPNAWKFLENFEVLNVNSHRFRSFRQRVQINHKEDIFKNEGGHTFFIPVDAGFNNPHRAEDIDGKIIDGHVITNLVLFTAPTKKDRYYQTLANADNLRVVVSFSEEFVGKSSVSKLYVKSHTIGGDSRHAKGVVLSEIVKPNIPVRNGVVHLIHKPLMVVDNSVRQLLEEKEDGPLSKFYQEIKNVDANNFLSILESRNDITLFAPSNAAWDDGNLKNILRDKAEFKKILDMHIVVGARLLVDDIESRQHSIERTPTLNKGQALFFNVVQNGINKTLTVEGGGVNATVVQADLAATNGVVHIIDRVLGVPYKTVLDKLRTDPMLSKTYQLGNKRGFNRQLSDTTKKFTYFVPRDKAWDDASIAYPSAIKKLFMDDFSYYADVILERHLVISDIPYTMDRIRQISNDTWRRDYATGYGTGTKYGPGYGRNDHKVEVDLQSQRDNLRLFVEERGDQIYVIHWKGQKIPVFRPNVECTNGIIHVIDAPFLEEADIKVSAAAYAFLTPQLIMIVIVEFLFL